MKKLNDVVNNQVAKTQNSTRYTAQKMKFSIKHLFSECDQIRRKLRFWSHLLKKSLIENFILCAVLKTIVNKLDNRILDATSLFHINQYNTDKLNLENKIANVDKKYQKLVD